MVPPVRFARRHPRPTTAILAFAGALVAALTLWFRFTPVARDTLWAEDGRLFLAGAQGNGLAITLKPYAGYLQAVPRLIADVVVWLVPVAEWARAMTAACCLITGAVAVVVFFASRSVVPPGWLRLVLASVTVLIPLGPREVLGNAANLHSVMMWGLFWIVLARPRNRTSALALGVVGTFAALSEIQAVFLIPLVIIALRRSRHGVWLVAGPALAVTMQLGVTVAAPRGAGEQLVVGPLSLAGGYVINAVMPDLASYDAIGPMLVGGGIVLGIASLALIVIFSITSLRRASFDQRAALVSAALLSPLIYVLSVLYDPAPYYEYASLPPAQLATVWLARYGVVPGMLLLGMVIVAAAVHRTHGRPELAGAIESRDEGGRRRGRLPYLRQDLAVLAVVGVVALLIAGYLPSSTRRDAGPAWTPQIAAATHACAADPSLSEVYLRETLGWLVPVQCDRLAPDPRPAAGRIAASAARGSTHG
jgi:hypothetical protein